MSKAEFHPSGASALTPKGPWAAKWVMARGVKTRYVEAGEGEPVILVHGAGPGAGGAFGFSMMIPALAKHFRVIAIDLVGFGESDKPTHLMYSHQDHVNHLADIVDALQLAPVKLVGNSWGAYVVTRFALDHPEKTERVFQIASGTIASAMGLSHNLSTLPGLKAFMAYDGTRQKLREFLESILLSKPSDALVDARHAMASLPGAEAAHTAMRAFMRNMPNDPNLKQRFQIKERLPALTIPMQMVWGEKDAFAPVDFAHGLMKLLPNVRIDILSNAGHQAQTDAPDEVNKLVLDFLLAGRA